MAELRSEEPPPPLDYYATMWSPLPLIIHDVDDDDMPPSYVSPGCDEGKTNLSNN